MPLILYAVTRASLLSILSLSASLYLYQLYLHRGTFFLRSTYVADFLRCTGMFGTLVQMMMHLDTFGVYGIWTPYWLLLWRASLSIIVVVALTFVYYRTMVASFPFLFNEYEGLKRMLAFSTTLMVSFGLTLYVLAFIVTDRAFTVFGTIAQPVIIAISAGLIVIAYFGLRHQLKLLEANASAVSSSARTSNHTALITMVKKWRRYAYFVVVFLIVLTVSTSITAQKAVDLLDVPPPASNLPQVFDGTEPPEFETIIDSFVFSFFLYVFLYSSWRTRAEAATRRSSKNTSSDSPAYRKPMTFSSTLERLPNSSITIDADAEALSISPTDAPLPESPGFVGIKRRPSLPPVHSSIGDLHMRSATSHPSSRHDFMITATFALFELAQIRKEQLQTFPVPSGAEPASSPQGAKPASSSPGVVPISLTSRLESTYSLPSVELASFSSGVETASSPSRLVSFSSSPGTETASSPSRLVSFSSSTSVEPASSPPGVEPASSPPGVEPASSPPGAEPASSPPGAVPASLTLRLVPTPSSSGAITSADVKLQTELARAESAPQHDSSPATISAVDPDSGRAAPLDLGTARHRAQGQSTVDAEPRKAPVVHTNETLHSDAQVETSRAKTNLEKAPSLSLSISEIRCDRVMTQPPSYANATNNSSSLSNGGSFSATSSVSIDRPYQRPDSNHDDQLSPPNISLEEINIDVRDHDAASPPSAFEV